MPEDTRQGMVCFIDEIAFRTWASSAISDFYAVAHFVWRGSLGKAAEENFEAIF